MQGCSLGITHNHDKHEHNSGMSENEFGEAKAIMLRLEEAMVTYRGLNRDEDNPRIPAGYTYLGQFIAHDISFSHVLLSPGSTSDSAHTIAAGDNPSLGRLDLSSIYGDGPVISPHYYQIDRETGTGWKLRLERMSDSKKVGEEFLKIDTLAEIDFGPHMDFPRQCPVAGEQATRGSLAYCADPRNDSHLLINQISVLLIKFHNMIAERVEKYSLDANSNSSEPVERKIATQNIFGITRNIVLAVYHKIIVSDFLQLMLNAATYKEITKFHKALSGLSQPIYGAEYLYPGNIVPLAFSSAAFRIGHVMVQSQYSLSNDRTDEQGKNTSQFSKPAALANLVGLMGISSGNTPLKIDWVVEMDRFFFACNEDNPHYFTNDKRRLNYSRLIQPSLSSALSGANPIFSTKDENNGGIFYRDLVRGIGDNLHDVDAFVRNNFPEPLSKSLISSRTRRKYMRKFFAHQLKSKKKNTLSDKDVTRLSKQTPLILYLILEATAKYKGRHLGKIGSKIIGGTIVNSVLALRLNTMHGEREWSTYIKSKLPFPKSMPALLEFMQQDSV